MTQVETTSAPSQSGARRAARLAAVQTLYQQEYGQELKVGLHLDEGHAMADPDVVLMQKIIQTATQRRDDIDAILVKSLDPAWPIARLELVLRAILRAGAGEILENPHVPTAFLITDYVDVAHAFFAGKEPGLVNAVLDRIAKLVRG
ncbi:MAG: transcription antitermination factor NusB [Alphaproteobacteria bacterium]